MIPTAQQHRPIAQQCGAGAQHGDAAIAEGVQRHAAPQGRATADQQAVR